MFPKFDRRTHKKNVQVTFRLRVPRQYLYRNAAAGIMS